MRFLGLFMASCGLLFNEWLVARLFSSDHMLEPVTRLKIWLADLFLIAAGAFIFKKPSFLTRLCKNKNFQGFTIFAVTLVLIISSLETVCFFLNRYNFPAEIFKGGDPVPWIPDEDLGYKPPLNTKITSKYTFDFDKNLTREVFYTLDEYGRRKIPAPVPAAENFTAFFGCSYTFGWKVSDDEALPYYFSIRHKNEQVYNYAFNNYGPHEMLARLNEHVLPKQIRQTNGRLIYLFMDEHVFRSIGSSRYFHSFQSLTPYFYLKNGDLKRDGSFKSGRPLVSAIYFWLSKSNIINFMNISFPKLGENQFLFVSKLLQASQSAFLSDYPKGDFYVVFFPGSKFSKQLIPYLKRENVKYLDYSGLLNMKDPQYVISKYDGHPSPLANRILAAQLAKDLG